MFALFAGRHYYPYGGWKDLVGVFDSLDAAKVRLSAGTDPGELYTSRYDWYQIVNLSTQELLT
jgi:hypothetical protein